MRGQTVKRGLSKTSMFARLLLVKNNCSRSGHTQINLETIELEVRPPGSPRRVFSCPPPSQVRVAGQLRLQTNATPTEGFVVLDQDDARIRRHPVAPS